MAQAQERVTITGDIQEDAGESSDRTGENNMLIGTVESKSEPVEPGCFVDGQFKDAIREKGNMLSQTWSDLFSLMNQYEAELMTKNSEYEIREAKLLSEESRLNLSALKTSEPSPVIAVLQQDNVEKDEKILTYMGEINSLEKELAELKNELQLKDFQIKSLEKELTNKDNKISNQDERIKVLDQRIKDLSSEVKNKDFVISQVSKQVRSMAGPGKGGSRKRLNPVQLPSSSKVLRTEDAASAISLRSTPKPSAIASAAQKAQEGLSSADDSAEDDHEDPKDGDYIFEGGVESVDDEFDHREPDASTSDDVKADQPEESGFEVSMAKHQREDTHAFTMQHPYTVCHSLTGTPVVYPTVDSKPTMTIFYHKAEVNDSPTLTPVASAYDRSNTSSPSDPKTAHNIKYVNVPNQQCITSTGVHILERLPPTKRRKYSQKRCRVCYRQGRRRETTMYCPQCPSNPGLCAGACFEIFHTGSAADMETRSQGASALTAEDEARSAALLDQSDSLLEEVYRIKTETIDTSYGEQGETLNLDMEITENTCD